jgi:hypothetical protein
VGRLFAFDNAHENFASAPGIAGPDHLGIHEAGGSTHGAVVFGRDALNLHRCACPISGEAARLDSEVANAERRCLGGKNTGEPVDRLTAWPKKS